MQPNKILQGFFLGEHEYHRVGVHSWKWRSRISESHGGNQPVLLTDSVPEYRRGNSFTNIGGQKKCQPPAGGKLRKAFKQEKNVQPDMAIERKPKMGLCQLFQFQFLF